MSPLIASMPPPAPEVCAAIAVVLGLILFCICNFFFIRMERHQIPLSFCRWIILGSLVGGLGGAIAGPIIFNNEDFPHWIGFTARNAMIRSFVGAILGICIAAVLTRIFRGSRRMTRSGHLMQFQLSDMLILAPIASIALAMAIKSIYVSSFVFLQLAVCVLASIMALRSAMSSNAHLNGDVDRSAAV
jgi:hypothetical protein